MVMNDSMNGLIYAGTNTTGFLQHTLPYVGGYVVQTTTGLNPIGSPAPCPAVGVPVIPSTTVPPGHEQQLELPFPLPPPPLNQSPPKCERCGKRVCVDIFIAGRPRRICSGCVEEDLVNTDTDAVIAGRYPVTNDDMRRLIAIAEKRANTGAQPNFAHIDISTTTDHTEVTESKLAPAPVKSKEPEPMEDIVPGMRVWSKSTGKGPYVVLAYHARSEIGPDKSKTITDGWMVRDTSGNDFSMPAADATEKEQPYTESIGHLLFVVFIYMICTASVMSFVLFLAKRL